MKMVPMVALENLPYAGKQIKRMQKFSATPQHAKVLELMKRAQPDPAADPVRQRNVRAQDERPLKDVVLEAMTPTTHIPAKRGPGRPRKTSAAAQADT